jgi:hypothetical protein
MRILARIADCPGRLMHEPLPWDLADARTQLDQRETAWSSVPIPLHDRLRLTASAI